MEMLPNTHSISSECNGESLPRAGMALGLSRVTPWPLPPRAHAEQLIAGTAATSEALLIRIQ